MKHNLRITFILLAMFVVTQFIGLYVIKADPFHIEKEINGTIQKVSNPALSWIEPPEIKEQSDFNLYFGSIIIAFVFAIGLLFLLTRFKISFILRTWFFLVVILALFISLSAILPKRLVFTIIALFVAIALAFVKIYQRNFVVHNLTELFIYPGIASVFVPILNFWTVMALLVLISIYDMWAVWHSGIMQKMAKFQINELKIFSGFFVPYISKKLRMQMKRMKKMKGKNKGNKNIKVNLAILGGGDVVFPIITAGVVLMADKIFIPFTNIQLFTGGIIPALFVITGATLGLAFLFSISEKKKFYPAMPFITGGIFLGLLLSYIVHAF